MKIVHLYMLSLSVLAFASCDKEPALKPIADLTPEYVLPQGYSSADPKIVDLYNKYGTYFLYDFTDADFWWYYEYSGQNSKVTYYYSKCDPQSVEPVLDFLDKAFFQFYPADFIKNKVKLYKVMLIDTLKFRFTDSQDWSTVAETNYCRAVSFAGGNIQLALGRVAPRFSTYDEATKLAYKNALNRTIWQTLGPQLHDEIPSAFVALGDYTKVASTDVNSDDYYLKRGFYSSSMAYDFFLSPANDFDSFIQAITNNSPSSLEADWAQYPLLKQKYDAIVDYLKQKYNVDLKAIFSDTF